MSARGVTFKSKAVKIKEAPAELKELPTPQEEAVSQVPSSSTRAMFAKLVEAPVLRPDVVPAGAAPKPAVAAPVAPLAAPKPAAAPVAPLAAPKPAPAPVAPKPAVALAAPKPAAAPAPVAPLADAEAIVEPKAAVAVKPPPAVITEGEKVAKIAAIQDPMLHALGEGFMLEELEDPYENPAPQAYVPESRRGFANFIKMTYDDFILPPPSEAQPLKPGDKYPYQKFIREYMRQASPYRGILVYHGLGSGKTCSAIAASEALFASAGKKVIVMTPFSLRKNFLKEVSFCGFRHFRLSNYWVSLEKENPIHRAFAIEILGLTEGYIRTAKKIWVPDFEQDAPNYEGLGAAEQTEIRKQIVSQLVWDAETNPGGRIRFINYNGISAKKLKKLACDSPGFFNDAVIIVDEIHNLIRLMQGEIDPYLKDLPGKKRKMARETVTVEDWKPSLCGKETNYRRGYLFYRLFLAARRSKIIGLSGTPLINFPEELGILANILHGYTPMMTLTIQEVGDVAQAAVEKIANAHPNIDYVSVDRGKEQVAGTELTVTLLGEGLQKSKVLLDGKANGVERIPRGQPIPTAEEIKTSLVEAIKNGGYKIRGEVTLTATPLLHPFGDEFRQDFLSQDGLEVKNKLVLGKRLTGLVSYYKGSRQDLMPAVAVDEVIRVPFSSYSQGAYSKVRLAEIEIEMQKKEKAEGGLGDVWAEVYDIGKMQKSSNYRMGSRQMCNFSFPTSVTRPRARNSEEEEMENVKDEEILETAPDNPADSPAEGATYDFPELDEAPKEGAEELEDEPTEREDKKRIIFALGRVFAKLTQDGLHMDDIKDRTEGQRTFFKVPIPLSLEELASLDSEFETLRFTPDGFSGVEGDVLMADLAKLTSGFVTPVASREPTAVAELVAEPVAEPVAELVAEANDGPLNSPPPEDEESQQGGDGSDNEDEAPAFNKKKAKSLKVLMAEKKAAAAATAAAASAARAEIKAIDAQVRKREKQKAAAKKTGAAGETQLEKMFKAMRDKDGKLPPALAVGVNADKAARAAGASTAQQSQAVMKAQEAFRAAKAAGASDEDALAAGAAAGAKEYPANGVSKRFDDDNNNDDDGEEAPKPVKKITLKEIQAKRKAAAAADDMNELVAMFEDPAKAAAKPAPVKITLKEIQAKRKAAAAAAAATDMNDLTAMFEDPAKAAAAKSVLEEELAYAAKFAEKPKKAAAAPVAAPTKGKQPRCKGPIQEGETYKQALVRSKDCLRRIAFSSLRLNPTLGQEGESLAKYSPKFAAILQRVMDAPGSSLVYSQFLDMEGIGIFRVVMDINDFAPIEIINTPTGIAFSAETEASLRKGPGGQMRYITFSGEEKEEVRRYALDIFNARFGELPPNLKKVLQEAGFTDNHTGQLCRVFCITSAGAEGLSLKNVRAVHIMEPYWNDVRLKQVKGRAIRIGSHLELPEDQRNVSIYTYISVFGPETQTSKDRETKIDETIKNRDNVDRAMALKVGLPIPATAASYVMTSDERLFVISERKKKVIEDLELVMKGAAVDCQLNAAENQDGTFQCLSLDKVVGDFVYVPELKADIAKSEYTYKEEKRLVKAIKWKGVEYWAGADKDAGGKIIGFTLYAKADQILSVALGTAGAKDDRPAEPVVIF